MEEGLCHPLLRIFPKLGFCLAFLFFPCFPVSDEVAFQIRMTAIRNLAIPSSCLHLFWSILSREKNQYTCIIIWLYGAYRMDMMQSANVSLTFFSLISRGLILSLRILKGFKELLVMSLSIVSLLNTYSFTWHKGVDLLLLD